MAVELSKMYKRLTKGVYEGPSSGTVRLKNIPASAPFVVNVLEGSLASLDTSLAMVEVSSGDDPLAPIVLDDEVESPFEQLKEQGLKPTGMLISLINAKRDSKRVTLTEAIAFFITYERTGVKIDKVSATGNTRGFYRIDALKKIARGIGLHLAESDAKGQYVESIRGWYVQNEEFINEAREASRMNVTLDVELGGGR